MHILTYNHEGAAVALLGTSIVESGMYFVAACLMPLKPLLKKLLPDRFLTRMKTSISRTRCSEQSSPALRMREIRTRETLQGFHTFDDEALLFASARSGRVPKSNV